MRYGGVKDDFKRGKGLIGGEDGVSKLIRITVDPRRFITGKAGNPATVLINFKRHNLDLFIWKKRKRDTKFGKRRLRDSGCGR